MIYYSHVNEDNRLELRLVKDYNLSSCIAVTGSGERVITTLDKSLKQCFGIDVNPEAQYLLELKMVALRNCSPQDYLGFVGHEKMAKEHRRELFGQFLPKLSEEGQKYWAEKQRDVEKGLFNMGHFERFLARIRPLLRMFLVGGFWETFHKPLSACKRFPHWRWRFLVWMFGQRWVYRLMENRDIAFIAPDGQIELISETFDRNLKNDRAHQSFQHHLVFNGHLRDMKPEDLPPSLRPDFLASVAKHQLDLTYQTGDYKEVIEKRQLYFDNCLYSTSDILSFVDFAYLLDLVKGIKKSGKTNVHLVFRSFLRNRIQPTLLEQLGTLVNEISDCSAEDRSGNYQIFHLKF